MAREVYKKIVELVLKAAELARTGGVHNILQPGLVKEMIMAEVLGHKVIISKRAADACDINDESIQYEYLSCKEGGSGQLDRMFKEPADKRAESLNRIWRNRKVYLAIFYALNQTKIKIIYELDPVVDLTVQQIRFVVARVTCKNQCETMFFHSTAHFRECGQRSTTRRMSFAWDSGFFGVDIKRIRHPSRTE